MLLVLICFYNAVNCIFGCFNYAFGNIVFYVFSPPHTRYALSSASEISQSFNLSSPNISLNSSVFFFGSVKRRRAMYLSFSGRFVFFLMRRREFLLPFRCFHCILRGKSVLFYLPTFFEPRLKAPETPALYVHKCRLSEHRVVFRAFPCQFLCPFFRLI